VEIDSAFAGTPVYHDGLVYGPLDVLVCNYAGIPAFYLAGIGITTSGELCIYDASGGLPADTMWQSGLPISRAENRLCVDWTNPVTYWHQGVPFTAVGAVAVDGSGGGGGGGATFDSVVLTVDSSEYYLVISNLYYGNAGAGGGYSSNQAAFLAAHPGLTLEDFTGIAAVNSTAPMPAFTGFIATPATIVVADAGFLNSEGDLSIYPSLLNNPSVTGSLSTTITFSPAINAAGFNFSVPTDISGLVTVVLQFYDGVTLLDDEIVLPVGWNVYTNFAGYATA